jgi:CRISPR/Cas system-associated exonuclease Cas4 (RecB family)
MSRAFLLRPGADLIEEVGREIFAHQSAADGNVRDLSAVSVLFPGKRPGHFLRKVLAEKIGGPFIPPKTYSIETFLAHLYHVELGRTDADLNEIDAAAMLFEIHKSATSSWEAGKFETLDGFLPLALKLFGELEELHLAYQPANNIRSATAALEFAGLASLYNYYERFYASLAARAIASRAMQYREIADRIGEIKLQGCEKLIVAGFFALTNTERVIFKHLDSRELCTMLFQDGPQIGRHLKLLEISPEKTGAESPPPKISYVASPDTLGQIFALAASIGESSRAGDSPDERTVVVVPSAESLFPLVNHALAQFEEDSYNISLGYPVARTPVFSFLMTATEVVRTMHNSMVYVPAYLKFALHPYTKNIKLGKRADVTRMIFHAAEEAFAGSPSQSYLSLEEIERGEWLEEAATAIAAAEPELTVNELRSQLTAIHNRTLRKLMAFSSLADFAQKCIEVLEYVYAESTAGLHPLFKRFAETLLTELQTISVSMLAKERFATPAGYFAFLGGLIANSKVPFEGTPLRGLQTLGFLETRSISFDRVYVLDANEGVLPASTQTDLLLPQGVRQSLGLQTYKDAEEITEYYFGRLLRSAKEVVLYYAVNDRKEPSRFIEKLIWSEQQKANSLKIEPAATVRYTASLSDRAPQPVEKSTAVVEYLRKRSYSPSALDEYLRCQLRFYYHYALGLKERDEIDSDVDQTDIGKVVHAVLKQFFEPWKGRTLDPDEFDLKALAALVDKEFAVHCGAEPEGAKFLLKEQILKRVIAFVDEFQRQAADAADVTVQELEWNVKGKIHSFSFEGRIDRVEQAGDELWILDFKTGRNLKYLKIDFTKLDLADRQTWSEAIGSLQLPMYAALVAQTRGLAIEEVHCAYVLLGKQDLDGKSLVLPIEEDLERAASIRIIDEILEKFVREIADPLQPFQPAEDLRKTCPGCPYRTICGTHYL